MRSICSCILVAAILACIHPAHAADSTEELSIKNQRIAVIQPPEAFGPQIHYKINGRMKIAATLRPAKAADDRAVGLVSRSVTNPDANTVVLNTAFRTESGGDLEIGFVIKQDMPTIEIQPGRNANMLSIVARCSYTIMPDLFANDLVIDPHETETHTLYLPADNQMMLGMIDDGDAMIVCNWLGNDGQITAKVAGTGAAKLVTEMTLPLMPVENQKLWISLLGRKGVWHESVTAGLKINEHRQLDWNVPFPADWRANYRRIDRRASGLTDSFWNALINEDGTFTMQEGLLQMEIVDGQYIVAGLQEEKRIVRRSVLNEHTGSGWWTYRGWFVQPFYTAQGQAFLKMPRYDGTRYIRYAGPIIIYPLLSSKNTTANPNTVEDILAYTLGPGYLATLDLADLNRRPEKDYYPPTCTTTKYCKQVFEMQEDHYRAQQIDAILEQMELFVLYTRQRIQQYVDWQQQIQTLCEKTRTDDPKRNAIVQEIEDAAAQIPKQFTRAKRKLKTPETTGELADSIVALIDQSDRAKLRRYEQICKKVRAIGNAQDELLGQLREIAKITRQKATVLHTQQPDPAAREFLAEVRAKTQQILRIRYDMEGK